MPLGLLARCVALLMPPRHSSLRPMQYKMDGGVLQMPIILKEIRQSVKNYVDMLTAALTAVRQIMQTCAALSVLIQYRPLAVIT